MFNLNNKNGKAITFLLIGVLVLICAMVRIASLAVHTDLPRADTHQHGYYDYEGIIHWHTHYSGGALGTYEGIGKLGNMDRLDFMITTEHNNLLPQKYHKEGWYGHVLVLAGLESSRKEGYLLGLNSHVYTTHNLPTDAFLSELTGQGGFAIIAHPRNARWRWRGEIDPRIAGQEIIDLTDQFNAAPISSYLTGILYYPFNKAAAYLQVYQRPTEALHMWDQISSWRPFIGIYAPDTHDAIRIFKNTLIYIPMSVEILPIAHDHVLLPIPFNGDFNRDKALLYDGIQKGRIFIAVDILQDATGFFFSARQGNKTAWMGDQLPAGVKTNFVVTLPAPLALKNTRINVFHNGEKIGSSSASVYSLQSELPGSYRVEVECDIPTFWGPSKSFVWIYSNPIYLR